MNNNFHLTLLDDDRNFLQVLTIGLEERFKIQAFNDADAVISYLKQNGTDGVILDLHMKETSGFDVCRKLLELKINAPIFFLSSDANAESIGSGFESGAIDYLLKTMPLPELKTRIEQRIRSTKNNNHTLQCGNLIMDLKSHTVMIDAEEVHFSPKEFEILKTFVQEAGKVLSKNDLLQRLWRDTNVDGNNVDTHMFHLRKKLEKSTYRIHTLKSLGYILRV